MSALETFAEQHFASSTERRPLLAAYARSSAADLWERLRCPVLAVRRRASNELRDLGRKAPSILVDGLHDDAPLRVAVLQTLQRMAKFDGEVPTAIAACLTDDDRDVRLAAIRTLAVRYPDRIAEATPLLATDGDAAARLIALSGEVSVANALLEWSGFPLRSPPPYIGLVLTPEWCADAWHRDPPWATKLLRTFGFVEDTCTARMAEWLSHGVWYVGEVMADRPPDEASLSRIRDLQWALLPAELGVGSEVEFDPTCPEDAELLLAAGREADASQLEVIRRRDPLAPRTRESSRALVCAHAPTRYVRRILLEEPVAEARRLDVPERFLGSFVVESVRVLLEPDERRRAEAGLEFRSRVSAMRHTRNWFGSDTEPKRRPIVDDEDFPFVKRAVLDQVPDFHDAELSVGANAVCRLALALGHDDVVNRLRTAEAEWGPHLIPVGCEWQIPNVDPDRWLAWKQALRALGIPSPRRPEYRGMLEVALPPAASWHAPALVPLLLFECGVIAEPQDVTMHVSVEGDLGEDARFIAFPQSFVNNSRRLTKTPSRFSRRVMSKGLVCRNGDVVPCRAGETPTVRTEFRMFGTYLDEIEDRPGLSLSYLDDIGSTALLATALASQRSDLIAVARSCRDELRQLVESLPAVFGDYFASNFHEATGDADDDSLHELLPVFRARSAVRAALDVDVPRGDVERHCKGFLVTTVGRIVAEIPCEASPAERTTPYGLTWSSPTRLQGRLTATHLHGNPSTGAHSELTTSRGW